MATAEGLDEGPVVACGKRAEDDMVLSYLQGLFAPLEVAEPVAVRLRELCKSIKATSIEALGVYAG